MIARAYGITFGKRTSHGRHRAFYHAAFLKQRSFCSAIFLDRLRRLGCESTEATWKSKDIRTMRTTLGNAGAVFGLWIARQ